MANNTDDLDINWGALDVFETLGRERVAEITDAAAHQMVEDIAAITAAITKLRPR